ncbi:hypothetical protein, partial [Streptobacillus moniliformis]|uniref:hypothetical protein n=1 Tax=Streptobacillus moniliformis TaxID=34105 RepID=UPI001E4C0257
IITEYSKELRTYGKWFSEIITLASNLHIFSGDFAPYKLYLTPQCGEFAAHQKVLEKFAEINKTYIYNEEDED